MSISQNFPEEGPTLNLNFAGSRTLDPRITFSRSQTTSNGSTYMGRDGLIKYAGPDEPRFDHRYVNGEVESLGLLIEEQRSNLVTYSEKIGGTFATYGWVNQNSIGIELDTADVSDPSGGNTASKLTNGSTSPVSQTLKTSSLSATVYTASVYLRTLSGTETASINVFLQSSPYTTIAASGDLTITSEWQRFDITTSTATSANYNFGIQVRSGTIYAWGAQLEQGSFPTSYIPTEGSTKTRTKDVAYIDGSNFTEWYNPTESTFFVSFRQTYDASATVPPSTTHVLQAGNDTTVNDNYTIRAGQTSTTWTALIRSASPSSLQFPGLGGFGYLNSSTLYKAALSINSSLISVSLNGLLNADTTNTTTVNHSTTFNKLFIGSGTGGAPPYELSGHIAQIIYYPFRVSNSQLQNLTK